MKKLLSSIALTLMLAPTTVSANPITPAKAKQIAAEATGKTVAHQVKRRNAPAKEGENEPLYIFSRGENQGYVFVSGSDCLPALLGIADSGDFDEATAAPALLALLDTYSQMAVEAEKQGLPARAPRRLAGTHNIEPLLTCHWHQSWPYNNMAPTIPGQTGLCATGCVATAASQILYYWRKDMPERTSYATPTYGWDGVAQVTKSIPKNTPLKWDLLQDSYGHGEPAEFQDAVALLNYVVGTCDYMGYNSSSGAYTWDLIGKGCFPDQFKMNGRTIYHRDMSQDKWESAIYDNLEKGYPMEYAGYTKDWEGHAIVLDGYKIAQPNDLYHFNFGWGGQSDGYYAVVSNEDVNGFGMDGSLVVDIYPKKPNLTADVKHVPDVIYVGASNMARVSVTNNSTLPYQGIKMYCMSGTTKPSTSTAVADEDKETVIPVGQTQTFDFEFRPSSSSSKYTLYVCDSERNILASYKGISAVQSTCDLTFTGIHLDGNNETETLVVGDEELTVHHIYNNQATNISATFRNAETATNCLPGIRGEYSRYDEASSSFKVVGSKTMRTVPYEPGSEKDVVFNLEKLKNETIYKFKIYPTTTGISSDITFASPDSVVYFKLMNNDLAIESTDDEAELRVTGHWNAQAFAALATDANVSRYDMTAVEGLQTPLVAPNANALFYVNASQRIGGRNIVSEGVADELDLFAGHSFQPREDFQALKATFHLTDGMGEFNTVFLPFECDTPEGVFARHIGEVGTSTWSDADTLATHIASNTAYIVLTSQPADFTATNVKVTAKAAFEESDVVCGTFVNMVGVKGQYILDHNASQYFDSSTGKAIPALTAYLNYTRKVRATSADQSVKDNRSKNLAQTILTAIATYEDYYYSTTTEAKTAFEAAIDKACQVLGEQPNQDILSEENTALKAAMTQYTDGAVVKTSEGYLEMTGLIANPSFESSPATTGWSRINTKTGTSSTSGITSVKITSSLANYMSGADGVNVINIKDGFRLEQEVTGIPNGTYKMVVSVASPLDKEITLFAGLHTKTFKATDFGPFYMFDATIDDIEVVDGKLLIGAIGDGNWIKVDNFRLYQTAASEIEDAIEQPVMSGNAPAMKGIYDIQGRQLGTTPKRGLYIKNNKKVMSF